MSRTILATVVIAGTIAGVPGLRPSPALAVDATPPFRVDCWIGMKFGDQPGHLIRGWICERRPAVLAAPDPQPSSAGQQDVAAVSAGSHRR